MNKWQRNRTVGEENHYSGKTNSLSDGAKRGINLKTMKLKYDEYGSRSEKLIISVTVKKSKSVPGI